jgi:hypothetical protein
VRRIATALLLASTLGGCALAPLAGAAGGGAVATYLTLAYKGEQAINLAITIDERLGCIIEAKDKRLGEKVSALANDLCAAMLLEKSGGVL